MNPSQPFIMRPVATTLLMIAIMLSGMLAFRFLPVAALPEVDYPTIQVQTFYPGASPDVMTSSITAPLEVQFGQMPNLNQMSSVSSAGASVITLQFGLSISLDVAEQEVQAAINAAGNLLPSDLPAPPIYAKVNPADAPILTMGLTSKTMPLTQVEDFVDTRLAQKISQLPGVGLVSISGGQRPAVRIRADIRKLAAYGLNIDDLRTTLANANVNTPKGNFDGGMRAYTINANDQIRNAGDYKSLIVAYKNGSPVRLGDVGDVVDGAQNEKLGAWMNETPAIILNIGADLAGMGAVSNLIFPSVPAEGFSAGFALVLILAIVFLLERKNKRRVRGDQRISDDGIHRRDRRLLQEPLHRGRRSRVHRHGHRRGTGGGRARRAHAKAGGRAVGPGTRPRSARLFPV